MALVVKDRVKQTTTTTGTGNIVLNGNVDGFQTFAAALTDGDTTYFGIFVPSTNDYEVGLGTWTEGSATLARTTILESSNSGSAINITAQAEVFITQPAEKAVFQDANGDVDLGSNKILFGNVYSGTGDLPSASTYHGMFAHVHGTGKAYYAHANNWIELVNEDTSGNVSMGGNLTVTGDLTVNGTTTTVNTTNTVVKDSLIELGNGTSGSPSNDAGIVIERGSSDNAFIGYDESADKFTVGTGSFTGATTGNLTISTGTLVANVEGNVTGTVTTAAQPNITSLGTLTTLTVDDITINGSTIADGGDLNIDAEGVIILDANSNGYVRLYDNGSQYGLLYKDSNDFVLYSSVSDGDMKFTGNDGGSFFTALTLDMSDAGTAIFNHDVKVNDNSKFFAGTSGDLQIFHDGSNSKILDGGTGNLHVLGDNEIYIANANNTEYKARFITDGAVELYYDSAKKFETTSTGVDVTGAVTADSLTVDDITINGSTISDAGELTIDAGGDIILDTDSGEVWLKDGGTNFGRFFQSSGNLYINQPTQDKDIIIQGNDGGANVSAVTFDMSAEGAATFNGSVIVPHNIQHAGDDDTYLQFDAANSFRIVTGNSQRVKVDSSGVQLGDNGNGYFQPVTGDYGSIQIDDGHHGGYEGYSIGGRIVFMHDNSTQTYLFNDVDNEAFIKMTNNGAVQLYHNGISKIDTTSTGVNIDGDLNAVDNIYVAGNIYHEGDTNTYVGFGADTISLVSGGANNWYVAASYISSYAPIYNYATYFDEVAQLTGTTPTINAATSSVFYLTLSGNTTFTFTDTSSNWGVGFVLYLTGNGSTVTWPNDVNWAGGTAPDAPANGETDVLVFHTRDGSNWYGVLSIDAAS